MAVRSLRIRPDSVRLRTTVVAVLIVAAALLAIAIAVSAVLRGSLVREVRTTTELRSADIAALARGEDGLPRVIPATEDSLVEVVDGDGREVATTPELVGEPQVPLFLPPGVTVLTRIVKAPPFEDDEDFVVTARRVRAANRELVVYAAQSLERTDETMGTVNRAMALGAPAVVLGLGLTSWLVMGRILRPVEAMRAEVAEISARDLTRRVPVPASGDELARLARTMNLMLERLEVAAARQRQFVADASHELQSPLASARAQLEVALAQRDELDWDSVVPGVLDEHDRMERLVKDLLFIAREEETGATARREAVDLDDLVLDEVERLRSRGRVELDLSKVSAAQVQGDPERLRRVIRNLLDNGERHARAVLRVSLRRDDDVAELVVADDGDGIAPEDRERVFDRFTRLDAGRARDEGGTGLGLAIAKAIVTDHGGTITVLDGDGARIAVRLPLGGDA
jgi:signal transduction histidine kinase